MNIPHITTIPARDPRACFDFIDPSLTEEGYANYYGVPLLDLLTKNYTIHEGNVDYDFESTLEPEPEL